MWHHYRFYSIQSVMTKYYQPLNAYTSENLGKIDKSLEKYKLPNSRRNGYVNSTISIKEFAPVIKNLPTKKAPRTGGVYCWIVPNSLGKNNANSMQTLPENWRQVTPSKALDKTSITDTKSDTSQERKLQTNIPQRVSINMLKVLYTSDLNQ